MRLVHQYISETLLNHMFTLTFSLLIANHTKLVYNSTGIVDHITIFIYDTCNMSDPDFRMHAICSPWDWKEEGDKAGANAMLYPAFGEESQSCVHCIHGAGWHLYICRRRTCYNDVIVVEVTSIIIRMSSANPHRWIAEPSINALLAHEMHTHTVFLSWISLSLINQFRVACSQGLNPNETCKIEPPKAGIVIGWGNLPNTWFPVLHPNHTEYRVRDTFGATCENLGACPWGR